MGNLFLPFTDAGEATERIAIDVKEQLGLGPYAPVDPYKVLDEVPARLVSREAMREIPVEVLSVLTGDGSSSWSAAGLGRSPVDGAEMILLNPIDHEHRQKVSLMEEIIHIVRDHPRTPLVFDGDGAWARPYDGEAEDEAYNVGAACILPYRSLFNRVNNRSESASSIARAFSVSREYVMYRIKRAGLYNTYRKRQRGA